MSRHDAKTNADDYVSRTARIPPSGTVQMFERLIHADWSAHDTKKWIATAERTQQGWQVAAPRLVPSASEFRDCWLFSGQRGLAGFDFPIGVPMVFGKKTGFRNFPEALAEFGSGEWKEFFCVADNANDISLTRPFYPRTYPKGRTERVNDFETAGV
jgi:hypothetical protein